MKFPLRHLLVISVLMVGSLALAACGDEDEEEPLSPTSTPAPATATVGSDPQDFAEFADLAARAVAEQEMSFFAQRVKGRTHTCTESDVGAEAWGIEQGLCQEVGQQVDVVEFGYWRSEGLLKRPDSMVTAIADYFASALPGENDGYGTGAVQLYATGTTRSSEPSLTYRAAILTAITLVGEGAASKPVRTARGVNFQYVDGRWAITSMLWADVLAEELLSAETAPYNDWTRY
jgi:hypothetical protein